LRCRLPVTRCVEATPEYDDSMARTAKVFRSEGALQEHLKKHRPRYPLPAPRRLMTEPSAKQNPPPKSPSPKHRKAKTKVKKSKPRQAASIPPIDRNGLTLAELRVLTNLDKTYTSRVLRRKFTASLRGVRRLAAAIEISVHEFCFRARYTAATPPKGPFPHVVVKARSPITYGKRTIERREIMEALGWDEGYLSRVLRGKQIPGTANALRLAEFFGCTVDHLIDQLRWR